MRENSEIPKIDSDSTDYDLSDEQTNFVVQNGGFKREATGESGDAKEMTPEELAELDKKILKEQGGIQLNVNPDGTNIANTSENSKEGNRLDINPDGSSVVEINDDLIDGNKPNIEPDGSILKEDEEDINGNVGEEKIAA